MRATVLVSLFSALGAIAAPATTQVLTPKGYRSASNAVEVPAGGKIVHVNDTNLHVLDAEGTVVHVASKAATATSSAVAPEETGWVAFASWLNTGAAIGSFKATWSVPPAPANFDGQTLFLFNSIEPATFDAIMQPVLQYGGSAAGGGEYWAVANWYLYGDNTFFTTPVEVSVGQQLVGEVQLVGTSGSTYNYNSAFTNLDITSLTVDGGEELQWATITLETYSTTSSSDYPTGSTVFSAINLELSNGQFPSIDWAVQSDPSDGITTTVNVEGSTSAEITITY
ncbi:hypothetical protein MSAN_00513000 [Mycena sanguinolenta]|uniref:Concanavalin A-like lectin/glucanase n=1 Tax=Mycena sanguinolenta TaxID=230812 RepID=A0A8H6ZCA2_9AGAR|nr:hypothetical protein MSAN_00513000 [Mycena sanguinolenta]